MPFGADLGLSTRIPGSCPHSRQFHPYIFQRREPDPAMPDQTAEKAWARGEEPQVFTLNACPGSPPTSLPAHPGTLAWLIGSASPTQ